MNLKELQEALDHWNENTETIEEEAMIINAVTMIANRNFDALARLFGSP